METEDINLCCGCLCSERKMVQLEERKKKECFMQIVNEISIVQDEESFWRLPIWLCWECNAHINRFITFTKQVKKAYKWFNEYLKQVKPKSALNVQPLSQLSSQKLYNISIEIAEDIECCVTVLPVIKNENQRQPSPIPSIKDEYDNAFPDTNSDDEKLIDISKKIAKVKKKKRKKKEIAIYKEIELGAEDLEEERKLAMLKEDYVNAMFRCERCILSFPNAEDLSDHISKKHKLNASHFKCSICECSFSTEVSYNYHTNKHTRRYQCVVCSDRYPSKRGVIKHFEQTHYHGPPIELEIQNLQYEKSLKADETEDVTDNSITQPAASFPCEFCDKIFRWKTSLRKHAETHRIETGQKRKPYCEPCRLSFTTTSNLQKHVKTSSKHQIQLKLRKLTESLPADSTNPEKRQAHIEEIRSSVNSSRQMYPCPQCDKKFQWRGNLLRHVNSHVARANGELVCKPCNRTFSSIATYKQHMKISKKHVTENEFKYMCSECGKRFANKTRLKDHVDWEHLKNFVHTCSVCQKVFKSHTSLYLHRQVVHKKDNAEHLCDHCGKPFPNHAKLRSHMTALHSGSSAYKCATCGACFSWHSCLSRHARKVHPPRPTTSSQ
ncbi:unnamed protein product [Arctia plantaginis]|uniref:C2H2-type domain-containing protein n=1 Tax=Arctia plantaginis TaxID=874455 RepID=A0A8S1A4S2_ARCPL|nr:unnamed protein product [Arctia plantaginis]